MTSEGDQPDHDDAEIVVACLSCGRTASLPPSSAGTDLPLVQLTRRLRCSECGSRAVKAERADTPLALARAMRSRMNQARR